MEEMFGFLKVVINTSTPILFATLGILLMHLSGVLNIGAEGMMLMGAFSGMAGTYLFGNVWYGALFGMAITGLMGLVFAFFTITMEDFPKPRSYCDYYYCTDTPCFMGDVLAVAAAEDEEILEQALKAVRVTYEDLPAVFTIEEALKEDAPQIREDGVGLSQGVPAKEKKGNVFLNSYHPLRKGDVKAGFEESQIILERTYRTQMVEHAYIEPESVLTYSDPDDGMITIHSCSQQGHGKNFRYMRKPKEKICFYGTGGSPGGCKEFRRSR